MVLTFEEAFEETGHGKFNYIVLFTSGLVLLYNMMESLGIGYVITAAECDLHLTASQKGLINAAAFIGIFTSAIFWGYLSDRYGRRAVMLPAILTGTVFSFCSSLSNSFTMLFVLRFLTGCLVSASSATVYAYLGEMHTNSRRSSAIAFGSTFIAVTFIIMSILAWVILSGSWSFNLGSLHIVPWRMYVWSWSIPGLVAAIILVFLPESPRYLYSAKGQLQALPVLARIYACNHRGKKVEDYPVKAIHLVSVLSAQHGFRKAFANFGQLLRAPLRRCVLISHVSMFMVFMLSSGFYAWMPFILSGVLDQVHKPRSMCEIMAGTKAESRVSSVICKPKKLNTLVYPISMTMGVLCVLIYISIGYAIRAHSKVLIYCSVLAACSLLLALSVLVPQPIAAIIFFIVGLCSGCAASVLAAISVEVFPTSVRALALCTLYMSGRSGAAVGANLVSFALQQHCILVLCFHTLLPAGSTLLMLLWPNPQDVREIMEGRGFVY